MRALVFGFVFVASAFGQWSAPIVLPHDSAADRFCSAIAIDDNNVFAVWVSQLGTSEYQVRGSMYDADSGYWTGPIPFTEPSSEIAFTGPALCADPLRQGLWVGYYNGSFPVDESPWGVYTVWGDSTGIDTSRLAQADTGVSDIILRHSGAGGIGMVWTDIAGHAPDFYTSVWFSRPSGDTWLPRQLVAGGTGLPLVDCTEPALCPDTGDRFFVAWSRVVHQAASFEVHVAGLPDTATLGVFPGMAPTVVSDLHGSLLQTNVEVVNTDRFLLARFHRGGAWTAAETLSATMTPGVRQRTCVDTAGLFWLIYSEGYSPPMRLLARYYENGSWSAAETVAAGLTYYSPVIVATYSAELRALWQGADGGTERIYSAHRTGRPGVAEESFRPRASGLKLEARPNPFRTRTAVSLRLAARGWTELGIFDASGRLVRSLAVSGTPMAVGSAIWDGTDQDGRRAGPGVYCVRERASGASTKVVLR